MKLKLAYIFTITLLVTSCTQTDPFIDSFVLKDKWLLEDVIAPDYPFPDESEKNTILLSFPKTEEYELFLMEFNCSGSYTASQNGEIAFTRNNGDPSSFNSEWDHYFLTLIKKANLFEAQEKRTLKLIINENNYMTFTYHAEAFISESL